MEKYNKNLLFELLKVMLLNREEKEREKEVRKSKERVREEVFKKNHL